MERREFIALLGLAAAAMPATAQAGEPVAPDSVAAGLIGTWEFVSSVNTRKDGSTFDRWGANPKGLFMFDRGGHYSQIIIGSESRVFGSKNFCAFGTFTIDEPKRRLATRIEACTTSRLSGAVQYRDIVSLTKDRLKYLNPVTVTGATAEVVWKRVV